MRFCLFLFRSSLCNLFFDWLHSSCGMAHQLVELSGKLVTKPASDLVPPLYVIDMTLDTPKIRSGIPLIFQANRSIGSAHLSMAMPVMVRVETKVTQTGIMPVSWQTICASGPVHLLKRISTRVMGETKVQRRRSLTARLTINMLLTCKNEGVHIIDIRLMCLAPPSLPQRVCLLHCAGIQLPLPSSDRVTEHETN